MIRWFRKRASSLSHYIRSIRKYYHHFYKLISRRARMRSSSIVIRLQREPTPQQLTFVGAYAKYNLHRTHYIYPFVAPLFMSFFQRTIPPHSSALIRSDHHILYAIFYTSCRLFTLFIRIVTKGVKSDNKEIDVPIIILIILIIIIGGKQESWVYVVSAISTN